MQKRSIKELAPKPSDAIKAMIDGLINHFHNSPFACFIIACLLPHALKDLFSGYYSLICIVLLIAVINICFINRKN